MSKVFFIADLHLGHKNIVNFEGNNRGNVKTIEEHDKWIVDQWNSVVTKQDVVWVLGDVAFGKKNLEKVKLLNGSKNLILGNHDLFSIAEYQKYFNKIHGFINYKGYWLSHAPVHTSSLRGLVNIHGHIHSQEEPSTEHLCVSVEKLNGVPLEFNHIQEAYGPPKSTGNLTMSNYE